MATRQLICAVLGHVDHGKTLLLDRIRGTAVQASEAGGITQHVGASEVPLEVIKQLCGSLFNTIKCEVTIPGLLFIDTPGHEAFSSLRERGGSIADIAVLVVDITAGFQPQTIESIKILKQFKVPFVIAANKIDTINGWFSNKQDFLLKNLSRQGRDAQGLLEIKLYELIAKLNEHGFKAERFDRVTDYTQEIAIVPTSALTGEGVPELLMVLAGLAQRYLEGELQVSLDSPAKGSVLEVKEVKGLGKTVDAIIYEGMLREGDTIVIGGIGKPIVSKARALLKPAPLQEMRVKGKFINVSEVKAASGVKISGPDFNEVIPGMPLSACWDESRLGELKDEMQKQISMVLISTDKEGVIVKADALGSIEAIIKLLKDSGIPIRKAEIGPINKNDLIEAKSVKEINPDYGVVMGFNVGELENALEVNKDLKILIIKDSIIYQLIDQFKAYLEKVKEDKKKDVLKSVTTPVKLRILPGNVFRASKPAIFGVEVIGGTLRSGYKLINDSCKQLGEVKAVQSKGEQVSEAVNGSQVAISVDEIVIGRNANEGDILYSQVSESDFKRIKEEFKAFLKKDELDVMRELIELQRKKNPLWGL